MSIKIPEELKGKELITFLVANKAEIIAQKKCLPKMAEAVSFQPPLGIYKDGKCVKAEPAQASEVADKVNVTIVANTTWWCDSHMDVAIPGCYDKSIRERKGNIPHLHDHKHTLEAEIADVLKVYTKDIPLRDLGIKKEGSVQCLLFNSDVKKELNNSYFNKYKQGRVKQHSIGLWYVKLSLAVAPDYGDEGDFEEEIEVWNKYYKNIVNKQVVDDRGFFWAMVEIKVMEVSAVLFGSNELTPTLNTKSTDEQPPEGTTKQPLTTDKKSVDFAALLT